MMRICSASATQVIFIVSAIAFSSHAAGIVCPVCGQTIDEGITVCPNDGTNLKLLGKPVGAKDTDPASDKEANVADTEDEGTIMPAEPEGSGGYRRHDENGSKKNNGEKNSKSFSDRRSRLPKDSRTQTQVRKKKVESKESEPRQIVEDDSGFFADYEKKRRFISDERRRAEQEVKEAGKSRKAARDKLLHSLAAPITSLGARIFFLGEEDHAGPVSGAEIDIHLARYRLRAGLSTFLGIRALSERNELVFLEGLTVGAQLPGRFSPFIIARGGLGMVAAERFSMDQYYLLTAFGTEVGLDAWVHPWLSISPSVGFVRCTIENAYWNSFTAKIAFGF
jgi:hypothetical protein